MPFLGKIFFGEYGLHGTFIYAEAAVDAGVGVDVQHFIGREITLAFGGMNAVDGADFHAGRVFSSDAGFSDHMCHGN